MKKSAQVTLTAVAAMGLACSRRPADPCQSSTFSGGACQEAVRSGGYYWHGAWFPMIYRNPYRSYVSRGGAAKPAPANAYSRPAAGSNIQPGATGAGHGVGE